MGTTINGDTGVIFPDDSTQSKAVSVATPFAITASAIAGAELQFFEATANGANYVAVKAPNALAANTTFTLPAADGTNGQYLQTNGSGALAFASVASVTPGGTTGQIQFNNAGAFGGVTAVGVANGGTGATTLAANNVLLGNGTSALQAVAPGTAGNVLTSNGTSWVSASSSPIYSNVGDFIAVAPNNRFFVAGNSNALVERGWTKGVPNYTGESTFSASNPTIPFEPRWSNYYNAWYGKITAPNTVASNTYVSYIAFSNDGINWWPAQVYPTLTGTRTATGLTVDDSNGRFFVGWSSGLTAGIAYTTTPTNLLSWTEVVVIPDTTFTNHVVFDLEYVDFGSTATSGVVAYFWKANNTSSTAEAYVIAAGTTTAVLKSTRPAVSVDRGIMAWDSANKIAIVFNQGTATSRASYVLNDVNGTWVNPSTSGFNVATEFTFADAGGGYALVNTTSGYQYSNTFTSWIAGSSPSGNIQQVWHNGTYWFMRTTSGVYYTATNIPTGWIQIGTTNWLANFQIADKDRQPRARKI